MNADKTPNKNGENVVDVVNTAVRPFGLKDKLGYMFGDFGNDFFFMLASSYLMLFYTNVLGISAAAVGTLFLVARCADAFTDVGMGRICDTAPPNPNGRYRVWIKRMKLPVVLAGMLMFIPAAAGWSEALKMVYIYVTYLLWGSICYTGINIPYGSMAGAITADPVERGQLSTFRSVGASLAGVLVNGVVPLVIYVGGKLSGNRFFLIASIFAVCAYICYTLCYNFTIERVKIEQKEKEKVNFAKMFGQMFQNRALLSIIVAAIILLLSMLLANSMNVYLYNDYFKNPGAMALAGMVTTIVTIILAPFSTTIIKKFGKKEACTVALAFASAMYFVVYFMHVSNPWLFVGLVLVANLGSGIFNLMIWAFITDVIDYQEVLTGRREDGTVYGVYSFSRKIGQALAGGLGGYALAMIGYVASKGDVAVEQTTQVVNSIYAIATLTPAIGYAIIALVLAFWYPLSRKKIAENQELLGLNKTAE